MNTPSISVVFSSCCVSKTILTDEARYIYLNVFFLFFFLQLCCVRVITVNSMVVVCAQYACQCLEASVNLCHFPQ